MVARRVALFTFVLALVGLGGCAPQREIPVSISPGAREAVPTGSREPATAMPLATLEIPPTRTPLAPPPTVTVASTLAPTASPTAPPPFSGWLQVQFSHNAVDGWNWPAEAQVSIDVSAPDGMLRQSLMLQTESDGHLPWTEFEVELEEGDWITATLGGVKAGFPILLPRAVGDPAGDRIEGTARPFSRVMALVGHGDQWFNMDTTAAEDGHFEFDFSSEVDWNYDDYVRVGQSLTAFGSAHVTAPSEHFWRLGPPTLTATGTPFAGEPSPGTALQTTVYRLPEEYEEAFAQPEWQQSPALNEDFFFGHTFMDFYSGFYHDNYVDSTLNSMQQSGVDWVVFDNYWSYHSLEPPVIGPFVNRDYFTFRDATAQEVAGMIQGAHERGMRFALMMVIGDGRRRPVSWFSA